MEKSNISYIRPKKHHNYVAFFLTLACDLRCSYCINLHGTGSRYIGAKNSHMTVKKWVESANRLNLRDDLPLTLQGGEPTLYKGFYEIVNEVKEEVKMDLLTNMFFDVDIFIKNTPVWRFTRDAPYAAIRASYHPGQNDINVLIGKSLKMQEAGFRVGLYGILVPDEEIKNHILEVQEMCLKMGIDFRTKEFLGVYNGKLYGTFKYENSVCGNQMGACECKPTELIVDPGGYVYGCHADLYNGRNPIAHILDENFNEKEIDKFRDCYFYGDCNPCDVKVKTNRFQIFGHTSVEIRNILELK
ncbi:MAG: hypothetical protein SCARUB_04552 [Candidatus Scalindua rubra]|uniref:Radical SAM core domain-containing protein n=1 Tax=Candidatus Scalindua rubra TaxID=1872076 RepID=A0A1E3X3Y7_9BACT|nr:MAG: hypothetical protein SCARUB_04552 [Candidatus Scalindua rubra]